MLQQNNLQIEAVLGLLDVLAVELDGVVLVREAGSADLHWEISSSLS